MLGNMGYSTTQCDSIPYQIGKIAISCPYGTIGQIYSVGVNPQAALGACLNTNDAGNQACWPTSNTFEKVLENSVGGDGAVIEFNQSTLYTGIPPSECTDSEAQVYVQFSCI